MRDVETKYLNQIHSKEIYHLPSGKYLEFVHDHAEKTFDAWEINAQNQILIASQPTTIESFEDFKHNILNNIDSKKQKRTY